MSVRDWDVIGTIILTTPTMGFTIKILPKQLVSVVVNQAVQTIRTADRSNGAGTIVAGGSMGNVKISLMPH